MTLSETNHNPSNQISPTASSVFAANIYSRMFGLIMGFGVSQIIRAAATFSLAEHLASGPATPEEIAERESTDIDAMARLLRACASIGLMTYDGHSRFGSTDMLSTLHKDAPGSLRAPALAQPAPFHWLPWGNLTDAIRTGSPQASATLGCDPWEYLARKEEEGLAFTQSMSRMSREVAHEAAAHIDTASTGLCVDVGGGNGTLIHCLMRANPELRGAVFDLPHAIPAAESLASELSFTDRFSTIPGDFFVSVPPADLYLLKSILHDWDDNACLAILKNCRRSTQPGGRIILIEMLTDDAATDRIAAIIDLTMLVILGGRQRSLDEYRSLLSRAGFEFTRVTRTSGPHSLIEAVALEPA